MWRESVAWSLVAILVVAFVLWTQLNLKLEWLQFGTTYMAVQQSVIAKVNEQQKTLEEHAKALDQLHTQISKQPEVAH